MSVSGGQSDALATRSASAVVTAAEIDTLNSAPIELAAGVPGSLLWVVAATLEFVAGLNGFDTFAPIIFYTDPSEAANAASNAFWAPPTFANVIPFSVWAESPGIISNPEVGQQWAPSIVDGAPLVLAVPNDDPQRAGPIVTSALDDGGLGYAVGDTGEIVVDFYNPTAQYVIDTVAPVTGAVLTYHLTSAGNGYSTLDNPLDTATSGAQPGIGTGFTVNVTAIPPTDGTLYVTAYYKVIPLH